MKSENEKKLLLESLRQMPVVEIACKKTGVSRATFYRWKKEDKEFSKSVEVALIEGEHLISDMSESQLISLIKDRNFSSIQLWLKTHHPKYKNRIEFEGHITNVYEELSEEDNKLIEEALRLAMPKHEEIKEENDESKQKSIQ